MHDAVCANTILSFPRKMIDRAFEWARQNKKLRSNPVHGEDEARLVLSETFEIQNVDLEETNRSGTVEMQETTVTRTVACTCLGSVRCIIY